MLERPLSHYWTSPLKAKQSYKKRILSYEGWNILLSNEFGPDFLLMAYVTNKARLIVRLYEY